MLRNVASQKYRVYAWNVTTGLPKTGDAANITGRITKDDGTPAATNDANPTEVSATNEKGYYDFDLTQAETDASKISLSPASSTSNISVIACPPVVYTLPQYSSLLGIASDGDLIKVNTLDGHTAQTGDSYVRLGAPVGASVSVDIAALPTQAEITGGGYALDTDSNGRIRLVDGTGAGEIDLTSGTVLLSAATEAQIDAIETDTAEIGTAGAGLSAIPWNAAWDAEVQSEAADALAAFWTSPATLVDLVWDEVLSGHLTSGTTGAGLNAAGSAGDPWSTSLPGAYGAGTAGFILGTYLDEAISGLNDLSQADVRSAIGLTSANLDTQLDALPTAAENRAEMDSNSTKLASILADTNELQTDDVPGLIAALNDLSQAEVTGGSYSLDTDGNGRIRVVDGTGAGEISLTGGLIDGIAGTKNTLDDLNDPTVASILTTQMTESYAADGTAPTLSQALFLIQQVLTEFAIVGTTLTVNKLDGSTSAASLTLDDTSNPTSLTRAA